MKKLFILIALAGLTAACANHHCSHCAKHGDKPCCEEGHCPHTADDAKAHDAHQ